MLMDEALNGAEMRSIVQEMRKDEDLMCCWENYHLISTTLRKKLSHHYRPDFSTRVLSALQNEPSYFLPRTSTAPVSTPEKVAGTRRRGVLAYALAASVTALAVVGVMQSGKQLELPAVVATADNSAPAVYGDGAADGKNAAQLAFALDTARVAQSEMPSTRQEVGSSGQGDRPIVYASMALESTALVSGRADREAADGKLSYPEEAANLYDYLLNYRKYAGRDTLQNNMYPAVQLVGYNSPQ